MKIKTILVSMLAIAALANCNNDGDYADIEKGGAEVAYLSIKIDTRNTATRASGENAGENESDLMSLYLVTFDNAEKIVGVPGTSHYFTEILNPTSTPSAVKISASATKLLVIANPGNALMGVLSNMNATTVFSTINVAIQGVTRSELTDEGETISKGFAMINSGDETGLTAGQKITDPLIDISSKIKKVTTDVDEEAAKEAAELDRVSIKIERLASKLDFKVKTDFDVLPAGATFTFGNWTLDAVNTTFYSYAEKTLLAVTHSSEGSYVRNFYTQDPNFTGSDGIAYGSVDPTTYAPVLAASYTWLEEEDLTYCIENTMAAAAQKYANATRVVVRGTYYPDNFGPGDWFNFAGKNYANLDTLQAAYEEPQATNLQAACDNFYNKVYAYLNNKGGIDLDDINEFPDLTEDLLAQVENGGEVVKDGNNPVIRWYQSGLCYYYYEIRHDNDATLNMTFGKYGVVRNNWYSLTLGTVNGPGTPWYPDINDPGPGDPDPDDDIDGSVGYLGVTIEVMRWIFWDNEIEI